MIENRERASLRPSHTFSRLPGFFARSTELKLLERTLDSEPAFTVLFGASSVGKTALLRQLLSSDRYHVLHFDLRIAGFADLENLYMSLSQQMEQYFGALAGFEGYKEFEKEGWSFKVCIHIQPYFYFVYTNSISTTAVPWSSVWPTIAVAFARATLRG